MKHHLKKTAYIVGRILYIKLTFIVLALLPFVVFTLITGNTNVLPSFKSFVVLSGSMEPTLPVGSITYTNKSGFYERGDVIAFQNAGGQTVTHRIIETTAMATGAGYKTQGDANNAADADVIPGDKILGKVMFHIPYVGYVVNYLRTPMGFGLAIVAPTLFFVFFELWNIKNEFVRNAEKRLLERLQVHE